MKPECRLAGENGNVFNLIGLVRRALIDNSLYDELAEFDADMEKVRQGGSTYSDVLVLFTRYVEIV